MTASLLQTLQAHGIWVQFRVASLLRCRLMLGSIWRGNLVGAGLYFDKFMMGVLHTAIHN